MLGFKLELNVNGNAALEGRRDHRLYSLLINRLSEDENIDLQSKVERI